MEKMTMGQRIAQKRKEQNLSQEALGEALGVSRQSISKWESDTSLPEIEKLVALSKLFGVSVGWLLGVEEEPPRESGGELTEEQLKLVEEIVGRYIAAQPKPMSRRRKRVLKGAVIVAACCLTMGLFWLSGQLTKLENQYNSLQNSVGNISGSVNSQINSIGSRVEEILQAQNSLTADYDAQWTDMDIAAGTVTITASAVPKTYREGMTAQFLAECDGEVLSFPAELTEGQTFSAEFDCPLVDSILVSVVFLDGDTRETQLLQQFDRLYSMTIPEVDLDDIWALDEAEFKDGTLTIPENILSYTIPGGNSDSYGNASVASAVSESVAAVSEVKVGLFHNQQFVAWGTPIEKPANYHGFEGHSFVKFAPLSIPAKEGDTFCYALVVTDEYGRTTVRGGIANDLLPVSETAGEAPELELIEQGYVGYYQYDDPADWGLSGY